MDKIENLNLVALRSYACAKVNGQKDWYLKCLECPQLADCKVGQRAHDILENETTPVSEKPNPNKYSTERFIEASKHPEPAKWLYENGYYDKRWRANAAWKKWSESHPDNGMLDPRKRSAMTKSVNTKNHIHELINANSDEKTLLSSILAESAPKIQASSIISRLYDWIKKYPDIFEGNQVVKSLCSMMGPYGKKGRPAQEAYDDLFGTDAEPEEDEVSIEDFLKETTTEPEPPEPAKDEPKPDPKPSSGDITPSPEQLVLQKEFTRKRVELRFRLERIQQAFEALDGERTDILAKLEALDKTAELFGMRAIRKEDPDGMRNHVE